MTTSDAYLRAVKSMDGLAPQGLEPYATFLGSQSGLTADEVTLTALRDYLDHTKPDDKLRKDLHLAIAGWDSAESAEWTEDTTPHSSDRRATICKLLQVDDATATLFTAMFPITETGVVVISEDFEPWYTPERRTEHEFYWRAYTGHLMKSGWDPAAIPALDTATTRVVERLSDPTRPLAFQSKGLVVGYVQSGKTANFTGVVAKAIDAGYRLIIVLTGTIDLLRKQTQRRLDMELIGTENIYLGVDPNEPELAKDIDYYEDEDRLAGKFLRHGFQPSEKGFPDIVRLTTHKSDYQNLKAGITALEMHKRHKQKPLYDPDNLFAADARIAVVKKNARVLDHLVRNLRTIRSHLGEIPTLIIDDESDQASVNTVDLDTWVQGQKRRTSINNYLSQLLKLLPRAQYIGYTATPYANVFVDPSDAEDIFPKDFIISLDPPANYMGISAFHDLGVSLDDDEKTVENSNEKAFVRDLRAPQGTDKSKAEMQSALDAFVISGALKLYREQHDSGLQFRHHTMLVHQSVGRLDHRALADLVRDQWNSAGYTSPAGMKRLAEALDDDFRPVSHARQPDLPFPAIFTDLKPFIGKAVARIQQSKGNPVIVVNSDRDIDQQDLDFEAGPVWRILVGGAKLSRGFTIEGLTVSYYRRKTKMSDSLMQMGRWFGYREGYGDLIRLFIGRAEPDGRRTLDLYDAFEAILMDEERFRGRLRNYSKLVDGKPQLRPRDIPPLVSQHMPSIKPTSAKKMWNAELVIRRSPGEPVEPTAYPDTTERIQHNQNLLLPIMKAAGKLETLTFPQVARPDGTLRQQRGTYKAYVGTVGAAELLDALKGLEWAKPGALNPDLAYLAEITNNGVDDWVVIAPQTDKVTGDLPTVGQRGMFYRKRRRPPLFGAISEPRHRPPAERIAGAIDSYGDSVTDSWVSQKRGAMLLYAVVEDETAPDVGEAIMAFTLFAPKAARGTRNQVVEFQARNRADPAAAIVPA